jgi:hypothetical protein
VFLTFEQLKASGYAPWCRDHLRRKIAAGEFPAPVVLSRRPDGRPQRIAWVREEVVAHNAELIAAQLDPAAE